MQRIEELGYSTLVWPDRFGSQWEPVTALAAIAAAAKKLRIGSLVYNVDYRDPLVLATAAATIQLLSRGRHEFGHSAGWYKLEYLQAGIPFEPTGVRIERFDETLELILHVWAYEKMMFSGKHYQISEIAQIASLQAGDHPRILVGGGRRKILTVAGRHAEIIIIIGAVDGRDVTAKSLRDVQLEHVRHKIQWIRNAAEAAGRNFAEIELNSWHRSL